MNHTITPRNVMAVVVETDLMLKQKSRQLNLNQAEVVLGLQELVGRIIIEMALNQVGASELIKHVKQHLDDTVRIGMKAKGNSVIVS